MIFLMPSHLFFFISWPKCMILGNMLSGSLIAINRNATVADFFKKDRPKYIAPYATTFSAPRGVADRTDRI